MVSINRGWWEHLAPKAMHRRFHEVETLLRQWCRSEYGAHWLRIASQKHGVIRVKPGQFIPVAHFVALGDRPVFVAPQLKVRPGHRMVGSEEGELALRPGIRLDVVEDQALLAAAARGDISTHIAGVTTPSQVFSAPAHLLLAPDSFRKGASFSISTFSVQDRHIPTMAFSMSASRPAAGKSGGRNIDEQSTPEALCCSTESCAKR